MTEKIFSSNFATSFQNYIDQTKDHVEFDIVLAAVIHITDILQLTAQTNQEYVDTQHNQVMRRICTLAVRSPYISKTKLDAVLWTVYTRTPLVSNIFVTPYEFASTIYAWLTLDEATLPAHLCEGKNETPK